MFGRIYTLIVKELLALLRDKKSRFVLIVPPLVQLFVFSFAATMEVDNQTLAILNLDRGRPAQVLAARFAAASNFRTILPLQRPEQVVPLIDRQQAIAVLSIPADFSANLAAGRPAPVSFIVDGRKTNAAQIVQGYAQRIVNQYRAEVTSGVGPPAVELVVRNWFNPNLTFRWYTVPSLVCILTTLIGVLVTALSVAREREMGTFDQLLVSPLHPLEILAGKALPALLVAVAEGSFMILAAVVLLRVPFEGSLLLLYASMVVFLAAVIGVGLFISALSMTQQQAILGTFVFLVPAIILSGFATPIENMPEWLQLLTYANPLRYFMVVVKGIFLKDIGAALVWSMTWPLALIAAVTLGSATWLFRRRME
ncbi:ABC transporter permease [Desulfuromonas carbonis]|uniref:ABC transporter permease n=1 Tax=Desulfuromonas sp. DDH964 TaxID=1823759 RepID=UPI00078D7976|nr:ABC transporter permease [Desulfuromonas sp. DDH964]AMV70965.1 ABC transporter membrane protein [Desulfuromonas sp. DDH964]